MRITGTAGWLLLAILLCTPHAPAQEKPEETEKGAADGNGAAPSAPALPGFVYVPAGTVQPGCTFEDYKKRATNDDLKRALIYDVWGDVPPLPLEAFYIGKYEVTNAQWKYYLDRNFRVEYETKGTETLPQLAMEFVKFRGKGVEYEWTAIYGLNWKTLVDAWDKEGDWKTGWDPAEPPVDPQKDSYNIAKLRIPKGLKLTFYKHRVPPHWYGWCRVSGLRIGREYVDATKPPSEAFLVPDNAMFNNLRPKPLRAKDFANYPVRGVSPAEIKAFCDWAGCSLPSEYEFERAGRGDRPNTDQYTMPGEWNNQAQWRFFAWANNKRCEWGPLPVDDPSVEPGDSPFGARHLLGNVWELTRTFYDIHPRVTPAPPVPTPDLTNYALVAKGGSFGDRAQFIQISTRTPTVGNADLDLKFANRADSLGFRLVRHPQPGRDAMLHTILTLSYDAGSSTWNRPLPHAYATRRTGGVEETHFVDGGSPYVFVRGKAAAIAFTPLWMTTLNDKDRKRVDRQFKTKSKRFDGREYFILGALRSDVPLRAGVRLSPAEAKKLRADREAFKILERKWKQLPRKKREAMGPLPEKPPEPDEFEKMTEKMEDEIGLWREKTLEPGEWVVVYWYGFIGLANKALLMPPDAIIAIENPRKALRRERKPENRATVVTADAEKNLVHLRFTVEEQPSDIKKRQEPQREAQSDLWALDEVLPNGWVGRKPSDYSWIFDLSLPVAEGALARHKWNEDK